MPDRWEIREQLDLLRGDIRRHGYLGQYGAAYVERLNQLHEGETTDMPHDPTFGFECEFEQGAEAMCSALFAAGLTRCAQMHPWHCDCSDCEFDDPEGDMHANKTFRFQTDSSCSGECISRIFSDIATGREAMDVLQHHADQTDAIPGWNAGFHVHVSTERQNTIALSTALAAFMVWEPTLEAVAAGRFERRRDNNQSVQAMLHGYMVDVAERKGIRLRDRYYSPDLATQQVVRALNDSDRVDLYAYHHRNDRHSNLSIRTRHDTWEFRLWNSTRSAWRMEMFCRLSRVLLHPQVAAAMLAHEFDLDARLRPSYVHADDMTLLSSIVQPYDPTLAELIDRQHQYSVRYRGQYIPELTMGEANA